MSKPTRQQPPLISARKTASMSPVQQTRTKPVAPPVYRPEPTPKVLQPKGATTQAKKAPPALPGYSPQPAPKVLQRKTAPVERPPAATPVKPPQHTATVLETKKAGCPRPRVGEPSRRHVPTPVYHTAPKRVAQPKMITGASRGVIQRAETPEQRVSRLRARIANQQALVEGQRATINMYSAGGHMNQGLRRGQLQSLIAALNISIPARQAVHDTHTELGEADPGNHQARIAIENTILTEAQNDLGTLQFHATTAWAANPARGGNWQIRTMEHWDRDPVVTQEREHDPGGAFVVVALGKGGRRRGGVKP